MRHVPTFLRLAIAAAAALAISQPVFSAGSGGGGGGAMPSQSAPQYDPVVEYQKGTAAFAANDFKTAITHFKRVTTVAPKEAGAHYLLGASYMALADFKKAQRPLVQAVKLNDAFIDANRDLAIVLAKLGETEKAQAKFAEIKARNATCAAACADAAKLADAVAKVEAALTQGTQARAPIAPDVQVASAGSADVTYVAAVSLINEHRYEEAIAVLDQARWAAGPHPDILTYLGFANRKLQRYGAAEGYYRAALAVAPAHRGALEYYGELKLERGDVAGAKLHLAKLDRLCGFGCHEADELRRWIAEKASSAA